MSEKTCRLWCFVEGDTLPFSVKPAIEDTYIEDIQYIIKSVKNDTGLQNIGAPALTLWKVHNF